MVHEGKKLNDALQVVGITRDAYLKASYKPEFKHYLAEQMRVLREHAARRSVSRIDDLADNADSEHVQLEASKYLLAIEGTVPVQRTESVQHHVHHSPGLVIVRHQPRMIADHVQEIEASLPINELDQSVPTIEDRNAPGRPDSSGENEGQP